MRVIVVRYSLSSTSHAPLSRLTTVIATTLSITCLLHSFLAVRTVDAYHLFVDLPTQATLMFMLRVPIELKLTPFRALRHNSPNFRLKGNPGLGFLRSRRYCQRRIRANTMPAKPTSPPVLVSNEIKLTEMEEKIFQQLRDVVRHYNLATQLRVAGGWVRDKLLGRDCYDIDIALDDMYGRQFCEKIKDYLGERGIDGGYCVIQSNPDQSKHLETARMRVFDMVIDFVNLRSERYSDDSRIPDMEFGTPKEDALRRDLTINSLFFNISTMSIEDYTGRGIEDLKSGRIVTPSPARVTFMEDPLRVLRAVRFGARFDFVLDEDLKAAATDCLVRTALKDKISRERIGHEIDLMVAGNQPVKAIRWIQEFQLFWVVFTTPSDIEPAVTEESDKVCLAYMDAAWNVSQLIGYLNFSTEQRRLYLYGALFLPLRKSAYMDKKSKKVPAVSHIFRNSLKLKGSDANMVSSLHETSEKFVQLIAFFDSIDSGLDQSDPDGDLLDVTVFSRKRVLAGLLLRKIKDFWRVALLMSTLIYPKTGKTEGFLVCCSELKSKAEMFERIENIIVDLNLDNIWEVKPLLDGNAIMDILQVKGRQIGEWQQKLLKWQLAHPDGTAEDCREWIKESRAKRMKLS